jgi:sucrose-6-phosphate hydrolase SacC (GH32 family)
MARFTLLAATLLAVVANAQTTASSPAIASGPTSSSASSTTSAFDSDVPTDAPIPGDYTGALRPQIHYSPPQNFMNDPNGLFRDADGLWHIYYQCMFLFTEY